MKTIYKTILVTIISLVLIGILAYFIWPKTANQDSVTENVDNVIEPMENVQMNLESKMDKSELYGNYYDEATQLVSEMTLEEKTSQMFLARHPDVRAENEVKENQPGGYILFGRDFEKETINSITQKIEKYQELSKTKMFIGVDEEGGSVVRVSGHKQFRSEKFKSPQVLYEEGGLERVLQDSHEKTELLKSLGINLNLAPVVDVTTNKDSFIYDRTLGQSAEVTGEYAKAVVKAMNQDKMISALKHFPGYGDNVDTHTGIATDEREYSNFEECDFLPFISGIKEGAPMILVNHNIVKCMDENMPASLSKNVHDILREKLGFSGLIITDDLAMDAVKSYVENGQAAVQAVIAGNDMIISSDFENQKKEIVDAVNNGQIQEELITKASTRIIACKLAYDLI